MRIGEVAKAVGVPTGTVRFYERKGLLARTQRGSNGYREYDDSALTTLAFIRNAQAAGLTLVEITRILDLRRDGTTPCGHVRGLLAARLLDVQRRRRELATLEAELHHLISRSGRLDPADCSDEAICHLIAEPSPTPLRYDSATTALRYQ